MSPELRVLRGVSIHTYKKLLTKESVDTIITQPKRLTEKVGNILKVKRSN